MVGLVESVTVFTNGYILSEFCSSDGVYPTCLEIGETLHS